MEKGEEVSADEVERTEHPRSSAWTTEGEMG